MSDTPEHQPKDGQHPESDPNGYKVGPGRPPKHTKFPPGRSGNPTGKRKREPTYGDLLNRILSERVSGQENGRSVVMTRFKAWAKSLVNGAVAGDPVAEQVLLMFEKPEASAPTAFMEWRLIDSENDIPPRS
jgi:hypothetical protein